MKNGFYIKDFDINIYHDAMQPKFELSQYLHARVLLELLTYGEIKNIKFGKSVGSFLQILKTSGINNKPQRHLLVKRSLYPIGYNKEFQMFEYINFFQIIGESCKISPSFQYIKDIEDIYYNDVRNKVIERCVKKHYEVILSTMGISKDDFEK
ncbi:MAG: hypothetical protein HC905_25125 [Bacteroidales bacterium]|nr:hypothetical protein [Bacteroidales bacterium]